MHVNLQDRSALRALLQQAREQGRLQQVMDLKKNDPKQFALMMLEFRCKWLVRTWPFTLIHFSISIFFCNTEAKQDRYMTIIQACVTYVASLIDLCTPSAPCGRELHLVLTRSAGAGRGKARPRFDFGAFFTESAKGKRTNTGGLVVTHMKDWCCNSTESTIIESP